MQHKFFFLKCDPNLLNYSSIHFHDFKNIQLGQGWILKNRLKNSIYFGTRNF
jgi:hypothetical protein